MVRIDIPEEDLRPDVVREAIAGRVARIPPSAALDLLLDLEIPERDKQALLREVTQDAGVPPHARAGAIRGYLRMAAPSAVPDLREALAAAEERVAGAAAAVLGQIGGPDELPYLRELRDRAAEAFPRQQASFAEALIIHRHGLADGGAELPRGDALPPPSGAGGVPFVNVRPGRERRARALEAIRQEFPWLDPARQDVYELQCGARLLEVVVDAEFGRPDGWRILAQRPALPAIVAFQSVEHSHFYPGLLALSRPGARDSVELLLTRLSGEPVYLAEGTVTGDEPGFDLLAVEGPGAVAVTARIRLGARGVEIAGVSDRRAGPARIPDRVDPPA